MKINREELAWAAGIFDGEGHARIAKTSPPVLKVVQCGKHAKALLTRFKTSVMGLGNVYGPYAPEKASWLPRYTWQSRNFEEAQAVAAFLWGFLAEAKRTQIKRAFGEYKQRKEQYPQGWHVSGRRAVLHTCKCGRKIRGPSFYLHKEVCSK